MILKWLLIFLLLVIPIFAENESEEKAPSSSTEATEELEFSEKLADNPYLTEKLREINRRIDANNNDNVADIATNTTNIATKASSGANTDITSLTGLTGDVYNTAWTNYAATSTVVGWSSFTTKDIHYKKVGNLLFVAFRLAGTSNATTVSFTLPNTAALYFGGCLLKAVDNGGTLTVPCLLMGGGGGNTWDCYTNLTSGTWTNSGTKEVIGSFWYEAAN